MPLLLHGTLSTHLPSILHHGLLPRRGSGTSRYHGEDGPQLVYAGDEGNTISIIAAITRGIVDANHASGLDSWCIEAIENHGVVLILNETSFTHWPYRGAATLVSGVEEGDWSSPIPCLPTHILGMMTGKTLATWLRRVGMTSPSSLTQWLTEIPN